MPFEVRINRQIFGTYATNEEAMERVREAHKAMPPDTEVELIDTKTGRAAAPGSSLNWREELSHRVGY